MYLRIVIQRFRKEAGLIENQLQPEGGGNQSRDETRRKHHPVVKVVTPTVQIAIRVPFG